MNLRILVLLLTFFISKDICAQNWIYVGSSVSGSKYFIRNSSIDDLGNKKVWSKQVSRILTYNRNGREMTLVNGYCLDLKIYDCTSRKIKMVSFAYYNSRGEAVYTHQFNEFLTDWNDVVPESVGEMLLDKVCELF